MGQKNKQQKMTQAVLKAVKQAEQVKTHNVAHTTAVQLEKAKKRAAKKAVRKQMKKLSVRSGMRANDMAYLKCLLHPELYPCSYPDKYCDKTSVFQTVYNQNLQWDADGNFWVNINPTMKDHIFQLKSNIAGGGYDFTGSQTVPLGVPHDGITIHGPALQSTLVRSITAQGNNRFYAIVANAAGDYTLPALNANGSCYVVFSGNCVMQYSKNLGASWTNITNNTPFTVSNGDRVRFQAIMGIAGDGVLSTLGITFKLDVASTTALGTLYQSTDVDFYDTLSGVDSNGDPNAEGPLVTEYRTVGMSALLTYEGDTLYNGGNIAGRVVPGGSTPYSLGWIDYSSIAEFPDSYEAPLIRGAYGFWLPTDDKDMVFRDMNASCVTGEGLAEPGDLPSLVFAGTVKNTANAVIRLRVVQVIEAKTTPTFMPREYSMVDTRQIEAVPLALRGINRIMENPKHNSTIGAFLQGIVNEGRKIYGEAVGGISSVAHALEPFIPLAAAAFML